MTPFEEMCQALRARGWKDEPESDASSSIRQSFIKGDVSVRLLWGSVTKLVNVCVCLLIDGECVMCEDEYVTCEDELVRFIRRRYSDMVCECVGIATGLVKDREDMR